MKKVTIEFDNEHLDDFHYFMQGKDALLVLQYLDSWAKNEIEYENTESPSYLRALDIVRDKIRMFCKARNVNLEID